MNENLKLYQATRNAVDNAIRNADKKSADEKDFLIERNIFDYFIGSLSATVTDLTWRNSLKIAVACFEQHEKLEVYLKVPEN